MTAKSPGLRTFDVFDTALVRRVVSPDSVFLLVGRRLFARGMMKATPEVFARARARAERTVADRGLVDEVALADAYGVLADQLGLIVGVENLVEVEQETERQLLTAVPGIGDRIAQARRDGATVAFLSDCVLPQSFVRSMLEEHGLCEPDDACWVSSDRGVSKRRGDMFNRILEDSDFSATDVVHVGDNPIRDVATPRSLGIVAEHYEDTSLTRYEAALDAKRWETGGTSSMLAGAARLARLRVPVPGPTEQVVRDTTAGVAAPILVAYVLWVLRRAEERGIERLYFVARDGEVLLDIARRVAPMLGREFDLRYLHGSRSAWCGPEKAGLDRASEDLLLRYLEQEGLTEDVRCAVIDLGWNGTALESVARLLAANGSPTPVGFYLALNRERDRPYESECWLYSSRPRRGAFHLPGMEHLLEVFATGTDGQTIGYQQVDSGSVEPILRNWQSPASADWHLSLMRQTFAAFVDELVLDPELIDDRADLRNSTMTVLRLLKETPTRSEATVWGTFPHEPDADTATVARLASPFGLRDLARQLPILRQNRPSLLWPEASTAMSPTAVRTGIWIRGQGWRLAARGRRATARSALRSRYLRSRTRLASRRGPLPERHETT